jgi:hypothetical protein
MKNCEYKEFVDKYFPFSKYHTLYNDVYNIICKNNILTDIYLKYSNIEINQENILFLQRYKWGLNKILIYLPVNDGIGINGCMRYSIEQLLKFLYSICFNYSADKINKTSYRHIKDDLKLRNNSIRVKNENLEYIYTYYAKYSNDVHDKNTNNQGIGFLETILKNDSKFINQVHTDLINLTKQFDAIMIYLFNITLNNLSLAETHQLQRILSAKQYSKLISLMEKNNKIMY